MDLYFEMSRHVVYQQMIKAAGFALDWSCVFRVIITLNPHIETYMNENSRDSLALRKARRKK